MAKKNEAEGRIVMSAGGVVELKGVVVASSKTHITFRYRKPRSSTYVERIIDLKGNEFVGYIIGSDNATIAEKKDSLFLNLRMHDFFNRVGTVETDERGLRQITFEVKTKSGEGVSQAFFAEQYSSMEIIAAKPAKAAAPAKKKTAKK